MEFRTQVPIETYDHPIDYNSQIVSLGSCFADNIGQKFAYYNFRNTVNPFGIVFHPAAIEKIIDAAIDQKTFTESDVFEHNGRWNCFIAHSDLSDPDRELVIDRLNFAASQTLSALQSASHVVVTLGTAWAYKNLESGQFVANCHKVPQNQFAKELLSSEAITSTLSRIVARLQLINPQVRILFTVSPVRHIKDGFVENQRSKAHLIAAVHNAVMFSTASYFPSYEIMMDDLRDYRFYAADMLHPNQIAIDYIWERFSAAFFDAGTIAVISEVAQIRRSLEHRAFNPESDQHKLFTEKLQQRIVRLQADYPHMQF